MTVTYDATGSGAAVLASATAAGTHACGANATVLVAYAAVGHTSQGIYNQYTTRTMAYNSIPMTSMGARESGADGSVGGFIQAFYLLNPPVSASYTLAANFTRPTFTNQTLVIGSVSYNGCGSVGTPVIGHCDPGTAPSGTVASASNEMVIAGFASGSNIASPTDTQRYLNNFSAVNAAGCLMIEDQVGAGSAVLGAAANADKWAWIAVALQPIVSAPATNTYLWSGSAWIATAPLKEWNGSTWVTTP